MKERLKNAYSALRKEFRAIFESIEAPGQTEAVLDDDERNRVYEMKASAWYQVTYHPKWVQRSREALEPDREEEEDAPEVGQRQNQRARIPPRLTATRTRRLWPRSLRSLRSLPSRELSSTLASAPFLFVFELIPNCLINPAPLLLQDGFLCSIA